MQIKRSISFIVLGLVAIFGIYFGICCFMNFSKAISQNYLIADGIRYDFMGFYIQGIFYGIGILLCVIFILFVLLRYIKKVRV